MKRMLCTINTSIWICCKTCYKTTKALYFYCTLCGHAFGFHKAVSVYHTWLSNNPVVGQTQLHPEDISQETLCWSSLYTSLSSQSSLTSNFTLFVLSLYYLYTTLSFRISDMVLLTYVAASSIPVSILGYLLLCCQKQFSSSVLTLHPFPLILHFMSTYKSCFTGLNVYVEFQCCTARA